MPRIGGSIRDPGAIDDTGLRASTSSTRAIDAAACWYMFSVQPRLIIGTESSTT